MPPGIETGQRQDHDCLVDITPAELPAPRPDADDVVDRAVARAARWMSDAEHHRSRREKANRRRLTRLLKDPAGLPVTMALTDEVMRISDPGRAAATLRSAAVSSNPRALGLRDHVGLRAVGRLSTIAPEPSMKLVHWQIRDASTGIILPAEQARLRKHLEKRAAEGARLNINVLGEAVLGEDEATHRLDRVIEMLTRPEVTYISVKISAIAAQLSTYDHEGSVQRVSERLRRLYRAARATSPHTFVNLDMEEYRDLALTVDVFTAVLAEEEFRDIEAGIVLQAYLPESHAVFEQLLAWARTRREQGGAPIKVRIVKGANLAMETAEAQIHGWTPAPYGSKADVDASWKRLVDAAVRPENADAVRVGIASHNLFDLAWSLEVAAERGVSGQVDIEMLEGMANAEAMAIIHDVGSVLLYAPVTSRDDFASAVAYLVRRLDENTAPENFLRASFSLTVGSPTFAEQERRFRDAVRARHTVSTESRRHAPPAPVPTEPEVEGLFHNETEIDVTRPEERELIAAALNRHSSGWDRPVPVVVAGAERTDGGVEGTNPSAEGSSWYTYTVATTDLVDEAVAAARAAVQGWDALGPRDRARILWEAARVMGEEHHDTLAVMSLDAGKTMDQGIPEVTEAIDFARYYGRSAIRTLDGSAPSNPVGVVVVVPPWNFPYAIPAGGVLASLAAGNAVILKPAPETVATAWLAGPAAVACRGPARRPAVRADARRRGGPAPGDPPGRRRGDPHRLVRDRADVHRVAARPSADGRDVGQERPADLRDRRHRRRRQGPRVLRVRPRRPEVLRGQPGDRRGVDPRQPRVPAAAARRSHHGGRGSRAGPGNGDRPRDPSGGGPAAARPDHPGARRVMAGGAQAARRDRPHVEPGVKIGVQPGSWTHLTEWFGPVLGVMRAPDLDTAIAWQNMVEYGLTAGIHALDTGGVRDVDRSHRGRQRVRQPRDDRGRGQPAAVRRLEEVRGRSDGEGRRRELRGLPARLGARRCRADQR